MVTPREIEAQILRYYHAEKWTIGTIARQLHVHHSVVRRVLAQAGLPGIGAASRPSQIAPYLSLIRETLEKVSLLSVSLASRHQGGPQSSHKVPHGCLPCVSGAECGSKRERFSCRSNDSCHTAISGGQAHRTTRRGSYRIHVLFS